MKTKFFYPIILLLFFVDGVNAQAPDWAWAKGIGGNYYDWGTSITTDAAGNIYTIGGFSNTVDFDAGPGVFNLTYNGAIDIFILKYDNAGNFIWAKSFGSFLQDFGYSIKVDNAGNVYATGMFRKIVDFDPGPGTFNLTADSAVLANFCDVFILKLDSSGNFIWAKEIGGTEEDEAFSINIDGSGNIYTTGYFHDVVDFDPGAGTYYLTSAGNADIFISKLDSGGNFLWAKSIEGPMAHDQAKSIATDDMGNVYVSGDFIKTVDFNPDTTVVFNLVSDGPDNDIFILKLDSSGNFLWAKRIGGNDYDYFTSFFVDSIGNIYSTGTFNATVDFDPDSVGVYNLTSNGFADIFISKLNSSGNFIWAKQIGGVYDDYSRSFNLDSYGNIYTTGAFYDTVDFDPDTSASFDLIGPGNFISKLNSSGNFVWAKSCSGSILSSAFDYLDNLYVTGSFGAPVSFDTITLVNHDTTNNSPDIFIAKLANSTTGIETITATNNLSIYPNPTTNLVHLSLTKPLPPNTTITIMDIQGRVIKEENISQSNSTMQVDVSTLTQGVYLLKVNGQVQRFVKI